MARFVEQALVLVDATLEVKLQLGVVLGQTDVGHVHGEQIGQGGTQKSGNPADKENTFGLNFSKNNRRHQGTRFSQKRWQAVEGTPQLGRVCFCRHNVGCYIHELSKDSGQKEQNYESGGTKGFEQDGHYQEDDANQDKEDGLNIPSTDPWIVDNHGAAVVPD